MQTLKLCTRKQTAFALTLLALGAGLSGCSGQSPAAAQTQGTHASTSSSDVPEVLATIGDEQITLADIRGRVGDNLDQLENKYLRSRHKLIEATLQDILRDRVVASEAKRQNKTVDEVLEAEGGSPLEPSEADVAAWFKDNQARTGGKSFEELSSQITDYLRKERRDAASEKLDQRLREEKVVTIRLDPLRLEFNNEGAPAIGPGDAPVTLVEFSDFQCPFCGRFYPILKQLEKNFGDKLRIVYRQYPIASIHANAVKAAEASLCANDQGKFWELHDLMFEQQDRLTVRDLKAAAGRLGLNQKKFDTCLDTGRYTEQIQEDLKEGARNGVTGTPALFVNGISIDGGAVPYEVVAKAVEKELERAKK